MQAVNLFVNVIVFVLLALLAGAGVLLLLSSPVCRKGIVAAMKWSWRKVTDIGGGFVEAWDEAKNKES